MIFINRFYQLSEEELNELTVNIEEIDIIIGEIINRGIPKENEYDKFLLNRLHKLGNRNVEIGKVLEVWEG